MTVKHFVMSATSITGIKAITVTESHGQAAAMAEIEATGYTCAIGDLCTVTMGYTTNNAAMITNGRVKSIRTRRPEQDYMITVYDVLVQATDYFMASDDPLSPFTANNISGEQLVINLLALAQITGVATEATIFTFATSEPKPINLISVWDAVDNICRITGFTCYADPAGAVHFKQRKPYIVGGDASVHTFAPGNSGDIQSIDYSKSDEKLRNKIVVYGSPGIKATRSAVSAYLPAGFYKAMVVGHELIDNQLAADRTGDVNLAMFNRLTETVRIDALGLPTIRVRSIVDVNEAFTGLAAGNPLWYTFATRHVIDRSGYVMTLTLVR